jgi:hypothetical protein
MKTNWSEGFYLLGGIYSSSWFYIIQFQLHHHFPYNDEFTFAYMPPTHTKSEILEIGSESISCCHSKTGCVMRSECHSSFMLKRSFSIWMRFCVNFLCFFKLWWFCQVWVEFQRIEFLNFALEKPINFRKVCLIYIARYRSGIYRLLGLK